MYCEALSHACCRYVIMHGAVRVTRLVRPPLLPLALHHNVMPHSQNAILVSRADYFTGVSTLAFGRWAAPCWPVAPHKAFVYCKHAFWGSLVQDLLSWLSWHNYKSIVIPQSRVSLTVDSSRWMWHRCESCLLSKSFDSITNTSLKSQSRTLEQKEIFAVRKPVPAV